jgi:hypothetical protein
LSKQIAQQPWSLGGMGYRTWRKMPMGRICPRMSTTQ